MNQKVLNKVLAIIRWKRASVREIETWLTLVIVSSSINSSSRKRIGARNTVQSTRPVKWGNK